MTTLVITGVGRGIGRALAEAALARGDKVIGTVRSEAAAAEARTGLASPTDSLEVLVLDVRDHEQVASAAQAIDGPVDVLVNNAAISGPKTPSTVSLSDEDGFLEAVDVNVLGPLRMVRAFLPHLRRSERGRVVNLTSRMGSLSYAKSDSIAYRASKAALNKVTQGLATDLAAEDISVLAVHPGWVKTDMGGRLADISPSVSAAGILWLVDGLDLRGTGRFVDYTGAEIPW